MEHTASDYRMMSSMCLVIANAMSLESDRVRLTAKAQPRDEEGGLYDGALLRRRAGPRDNVGSGPERIRSQQLMDLSTSRSPVIRADAIARYWRRGRRTRRCDRH